LLGPAGRKTACASEPTVRRPGPIGREDADG
jgi:hypothetical protein